MSVFVASGDGVCCVHTSQGLSTWPKSQRSRNGNKGEGSSCTSMISANRQVTRCERAEWLLLHFHTLNDSQGSCMALPCANILGSMVQPSHADTLQSYQKWDIRLDLVYLSTKSLPFTKGRMVSLW